MSSPAAPPPLANSFMNNPLINTITGYIVDFQQRNLLSKESLQSLRQCFLITIGFVVLLYCLIQIQILFFWLLKLIFRLIFKIFSIIFWLPLKTIRLIIPKTIDYDILFPLFWLCSISSFYISKFFHENICQFYDQHLVRRYKILNYDQTKREDVRRYLFVVTFIILLLLQSLFILIPIASSIRHQHANAKVSSRATVSVTQTTTVKPTTTKSAVKEVVETMSGNLYNRFIDAFTDENEVHINEKRSPLISDEKLEDTFKTIKHGMKDFISQDKQKEIDEEKKSSRFQRWIVYYLKAPFQKWESKKTEIVNSHIGQKELEDESEEEENVELNSSSSISDSDESEDEDEDDEDDDDSSETDDDDEEHTTITERIKQRLGTVQNLGEQLKENIESKISSSIKSEDDEDSDDDDEEEEEDSPSLEDRLTKPIETAKKLLSSTDSDDDESDDDEDESTIDKIKEQIDKPIEKIKTIAETVVSQLQNKLSSSAEDDDEESGYESDEEDDSEEQPSKLIEKIKETLAEPIEEAKTVAANIKTKITSLTDHEDVPVIERIKESLAKPIETVKDLGEKVITNVKDQLSSSTNTDEEDSGIDSDEELTSILSRVKENIIKPIETAATNLQDRLPSLPKINEDLSLIESAEQMITPIKDKISSNADLLQQKASNLVDSAEEFASNVVEKSSEYLKEKAEKVKESLPKPDKIKSKIKHQLVKPLEAKASKIKKKIKTKTEHVCIPLLIQPLPLFISFS